MPLQTLCFGQEVHTKLSRQVKQTTARGSDLVERRSQANRKTEDQRNKRLVTGWKVVPRTFRNGSSTASRNISKVPICNCFISVVLLTPLVGLHKRNPSMKSRVFPSHSSHDGVPRLPSNRIKLLLSSPSLFERQNHSNTTLPTLKFYNSTNNNETERKS